MNNQLTKDEIIRQMSLQKFCDLVHCSYCQRPCVPKIQDNKRLNYAHLCTVCMAMFDAVRRLAISEKRRDFLKRYIHGKAYGYRNSDVPEELDDIQGNNFDA